MLAIYARVSTESQRDDETIEQQIDLANEFISKNNIVDYQIYKDDGISGGSDEISDRPALLSLLDDCKSKMITEVWTSKWDRLARNVLVYSILMNQLRKLNVSVYFLNEKFNFDDPQERFKGNILASVAEYEKELIKIRTTSGRKKLQDKGLYGKSNLFGYTKAGRDTITGRVVYTPNDEELKLMKTIYDNMLLGKSIHYIAKNIIGIKNNGSWASRVRYPEYAGYTKNSKGELIQSQIYKPIISLDDWQKVQILINESSLKVKSSLRKANFLSSGLLRCWYCNAGFYSQFSQKKETHKRYYYYRQNLLNYTDCPAKYNMIPVEKADSIFDFFYLFHFANQENFMLEAEKLKKEIIEKNKDNSILIKNLQSEIATENKKLERIMKAIMDGITNDMFKVQAQQITDSIEKYKSEISNLMNLQDIEMQKVDEDSKEILSISIEKYLSSETSEKRVMISKIIAKAIVKDNLICISSTNNKHYFFNKKGLNTQETSILYLLKNHKSLVNHTNEKLELSLGYKKDDGIERIQWEIKPLEDLENYYEYDCMITENDLFPLVAWDFV